MNPQGLVSCIIPSQTYARFGRLPALCPSTWQKIWRMTPKEFDENRAYRVDFEVYNVRARDQKNAEIDLYIGIVSQK